MKKAHLSALPRPLAAHFWPSRCINIANYLNRDLIAPQLIGVTGSP
jgi:hypothetical protein